VRFKQLVGERRGRKCSKESGVGLGEIGGGKLRGIMERPLWQYKGGGIHDKGRASMGERVGLNQPLAPGTHLSWRGQEKKRDKKRSSQENRTENTVHRVKNKSSTVFRKKPFGNGRVGSRRPYHQQLQ